MTSPIATPCGPSLQAALAIEEDPWHKPKEAQVDLRQFIPIKLAEVV